MKVNGQWSKMILYFTQEKTKANSQKSDKQEKANILQAGRNETLFTIKHGKDK